MEFIDEFENLFIFPEDISSFFIVIAPMIKHKKLNDIKITALKDDS
tara:strand:+ start:4734 stop:4871 length:138 start_codon:yes stop_codon:yes gene_type:complete